MLPYILQHLRLIVAVFFQFAGEKKKLREQLSNLRQLHSGTGTVLRFNFCTTFFLKIAGALLTFVPLLKFVRNLEEERSHYPIRCPARSALHPDPGVLLSTPTRVHRTSGPPKGVFVFAYAMRLSQKHRISPPNGRRSTRVREPHVAE